MQISNVADCEPVINRKRSSFVIWLSTDLRPPSALRRTSACISMYYEWGY